MDERGMTADADVGPPSGTRQVSAVEMLEVLLDELTSVTSEEERAVHNPAWLRRYVAGITSACRTVVELGVDGRPLLTQ